MWLVVGLVVYSGFKKMTDENEQCKILITLNATL